MRYVIVVTRKGSSEEGALADALAGLTSAPRSVYIVGVTDEYALARSLAGHSLLDHEDVDADLALHTMVSIAVGTEDSSVSFAQLIERAKTMIAEAERRTHATLDATRR